MKLPLINFSNLKQESPSWVSVKMEVKKALEEYGCFEATFDDIPLHVRESVFDAIRQVHDLPLDTKLRAMSNKAFHGYHGQLPEYPLYESLGIEDAIAPQKVDAFTDLLWPEHNPTCSKSLHSYAKQLHQLDVKIRTMILEILGLEKYLDEHMDSIYHFLRFQKYDACHEPKLGLIEHTDKNLLTILYEDQVSGLQIETKDGQWTTVQPSANSFLVIIGVTFHAWTNARLHAVNHRVISGDKERYSVGLFAFPKPGYIIKAPEETVDEEHPLVYKPYESWQFFDFFNSGASSGYPHTLKDFCGVQLSAK